MAGVSTLAVLSFSCKGKLGQAAAINLAETPVQTVERMFAVQSKNGILDARMEAPVMERYDNDTTSYECFPKGVSLYGYTPDGRLETIIVADNAKHIIGKGKSGSAKTEVWEAFGNVIVHNVIKQETMETDTLYWDNKAHEIWTDCYIRLSSPSGYMQGVGMRSDEKARNAILHHPFDNEFLIDNDTTKVVIDTVNFIGPIPKK